MPGTVTKLNAGNRYTYFEFHDGTKTVHKYCGREGAPKAEWRWRKFEYDLLKNRTEAQHKEDGPAEKRDGGDRLS